MANPPLSKFADARQGLATSDNNRFLSLWHEVELANIGLNMASSTEAQSSNLMWFPYTKGGSFVSGMVIKIVWLIGKMMVMK